MNDVPSFNTFLANKYYDRALEQHTDTSAFDINGPKRKLKDRTGKKHRVNKNLLNYQTITRGNPVESFRKPNPNVAGRHCATADFVRDHSSLNGRKRHRNQDFSESPSKWYLLKQKVSQFSNKFSRGNPKQNLDENQAEKPFENNCKSICIQCKSRFKKGERKKGKAEPLYYYTIEGSVQVPVQVDENNMLQLPIMPHITNNYSSTSLTETVAILDTEKEKHNNKKLFRKQTNNECQTLGIEKYLPYNKDKEILPTANHGRQDSIQNEVFIDSHDLKKGRAPKEFSTIYKLPECPSLPTTEFKNFSENCQFSRPEQYNCSIYNSRIRMDDELSEQKKISKWSNKKRKMPTITQAVTRVMHKEAMCEFKDNEQLNNFKNDRDSCDHSSNVQEHYDVAIDLNEQRKLKPRNVLQQTNMPTPEASIRDSVDKDVKQSVHEYLTKVAQDKYGGEIICIHNPPCILINGCLNLPPNQQPPTAVYAQPSKRFGFGFLKNKGSGCDKNCQVDPWCISLPQCQTSTSNHGVDKETQGMGCNLERTVAYFRENSDFFETTEIDKFVMRDEETQKSCICKKKKDTLCSQTTTCERENICIQAGIEEGPRLGNYCVHVPMCQAFPKCVAEKQMFEDASNSEDPLTKLSEYKRNSEIQLWTKEYEADNVSTQVKPKRDTETENVCVHVPVCPKIPRCIIVKNQNEFKSEPRNSVYPSYMATTADMPFHCNHKPKCRTLPECVTNPSETCLHQPQCQKVPLCEKRYVALTAKESISTQAKPKMNLTCRHSPPCLMLPRCIAHNLNEHMLPYESIPECTHLPRCELIPACQRRSRKEAVTKCRHHRCKKKSALPARTS